MFEELVKYLNKIAGDNFKEATQKIRCYIGELNIDDFCQIVKNIGTIPENIAHDSTEEKLYAKASDIVLARCFCFLGMDAKALDERADSADILAESTKGYQYSLVADAKCFRLSRTAKNQKDFKVSNLSNWRGSENEYAVLVAPYFQYPQNKSQIYAAALEYNVCLMAWEHVSLLLENGIKETENYSLESLWNSSQMIARDSSLAFSNRKDCLLRKMDRFVARKLQMDETVYMAELEKFKRFLVIRGKAEISYWENQIEIIKRYSKEQAIQELIAAKKLNEKIAVISSYIDKLKC